MEAYIYIGRVIVSIPWLPLAGTLAGFLKFLARFEFLEVVS